MYDEIDYLPLTPSCLVAGRRLLDQVTISDKSAAADARLLGKCERQLNLLLTHFRNRWRNEYLTGIREYQRLSSTKYNHTVKVGDIVHIQDKVPRMGKVDKLVPGRDSVVRAAELTTLDKSQRIIRVKRPIQKLYPLEVSAAVSDKSDKTVTMVTDADVPFVRMAQ